MEPQLQNHVLDNKIPFRNGGSLGKNSVIFETPWMPNPMSEDILDEFMASISVPNSSPVASRRRLSSDDIKEVMKSSNSSIVITLISSHDTYEDMDDVIVEV